MTSPSRRLAKAERGAVAPTVALSLFALMATAGIAFDYSRLVSVDTELQHAADQAALAGATQLDGQSGARDRATAAAKALFDNITLEANDGSAVAVTINDVVFYATKAEADADNGTDCPAANATSPVTDATAKFLCVRTENRTANFTLTPVVGALSAPNLSAMGVAGLGSAICKVPPLMMCNPEETATNLLFNVSNYRGKGIRLVEGGSGAAWAPGNFGYLVSGLQNGANALEYALGANNPPGNCLPTDGVTTKPGENTSVTDAINTRFDIYENGLVNDCTTGSCSPSVNVRKDVVRPSGSTNFGFKTGNDPWDLPSVQYLPGTNGVQATPYPTSMGHPRDICHSISSDGNCPNGRIGNGSWDRNLYFYVNHRGLYTPAVAGVPDANWKTIPSLMAYATANSIDLDKLTRYETYRWEIQQDALAAYVDHTTTGNGNGNSGGSNGGGSNGGGSNGGGSNGGGQSTKTYYNYGRPQAGTGLAAGPTQMDRRLTSVAVVNCINQGVQGQSKNVTVAKWVEVFFVEPSLARSRTSAADIYVEVVRQTTAGGNAPTNPQVVRRDVPYLVQ